MNLRETYNRIAEYWKTDHAKDDWWVTGTDTFISLLQPGSHVLDVGCGVGIKSKYLSEKGLRVLGIDFSEKMIDLCKQDVPEAEFRVLDAYALDTLEETFDGIFMQAFLLHIPRKDASSVVRSAVEKIKSGGLLYIAVKEKQTGKPDEAILKEEDYGFAYERFFSYFSQEEIENYMKDLGLEVIFSTVALSGKTNWIQVIGKKR